MPKSCVIPNHVANPTTKWNYKGCIPCKQYSNVQGETLSITKPLAIKNLKLKAESMKSAIASGQTTKVEAIRHLMRVNRLSLHEAIGLLSL